MGFNEINSDGGLVLVGAMKNKPKLRIFNIDGNCFGQEGCEQVIAEMAKLGNAAALHPFEEDASEDEDAEDESGDEGDDGDQDEEYEEDEGEEYDEHEHANDTTEEADEEDEEYADEAAEETAYVTTNAYATKVRGILREG